MFPHCWIGRGSELEWPARSPDLAPNDFFYGGFLKFKVFDGDELNLEELKKRIRDASRDISSLQLVTNVLNHFHDRLAHCLAVNGGIFKNLL